MSSPQTPTTQSRLGAKWLMLLLLWIGVIFFSSTALAGREADSAFSNIVLTYWRRIDTADLYDRWSLHFYAEKSVHFFLFLTFAFLLWQVFPATRLKAIGVFASGALLGCCSEVAQSFFPARDPTVRDALINMTGTAAGVAISVLLSRRQRQRRETH